MAHWEEQCEVIQWGKSLCHVQHTIRRLDKHTDMSINRSMHELGRLMGEGKESYWKLPKDFWTAMEKGVHGYARHPEGGAIHTSFPPTYDNRRNRLKLKFREQDKIGWDNILKGRMRKQWIEYVKIYIDHENIKLQAKEWAPKMILALWDHMLRLWQYRNNALHEDDCTPVAQFKVEALDPDIARLAVRHNALRSKLHEVQERHMERREHIQTFKHNSRQCWASLAKLYLDEAENRIETDNELHLC
jgi:hypothetical protein